MTSLFDWAARNAEDVEAEIVSRVESSITLRPYQSEAVERVFDEWDSVASTLVCLPTGTGKSVVFSGVMRRWADREAVA